MIETPENIEGLLGMLEPPPKPRKARNRTDKYIFYLRLLDARDDTAPHRTSFEKISHVLEKEKKRLVPTLTKESVWRSFQQALATQELFLDRCRGEMENGCQLPQK